jgi:hypothetical protein
MRAPEGKRNNAADERGASRQVEQHARSLEVLSPMIGNSTPVVATSLDSHEPPSG